MRTTLKRAFLLIAAAAFALSVDFRAPTNFAAAQAQDSPDDDEDDEDDEDDDLGGDGGGDDDVGNDGADDGSDDGDDDADPGGDGDDAGDDGAGGDDDDGSGGDDDDGSGGGDDDGPGGDDDDGPGGDDDDGPGGDDDDGPGGDDDDGPGGDDDDGPGGDDDDGPGGDDDDGPGGDDDDDNSSDGVEDGDFVEAASNVPPDGIELDSDGGWIRNGEILALEADPTSLEFARALGFRVVERHQLTTLGVSIVELRVPRGQATREALEALRRGDPGTAYDFNHVYLPTQSPPARALPAARTRGAPAISGNVGIVDTAVDADHPALSRAQIVQSSFVQRAQTLDHGTAIASLLVENGAGTQGTVYAATVVEGGPTRANAFGTAESLVRGLDWLARNEAAVVNVSLAGPPNMLLEDAVRRARARGMIIVAAVGNDGPAAPPLYPAAYEGVVGVTAVDANDQVYRRAGRGPHVDFAAPGVGVSVAGSSGEYTAVSGTSYASPVVAAALARRHARPDVRSAQAAVRDLLGEAQDAGDVGLDQVYGAGVIRPGRQ